MIPVWSRIPAYSPRLLPLSCGVAEGMRDAIVVIPGDGEWADRTAEAVRAGALAIVVADPDPLPAPRLDALRASAGGMPIVLDRALFPSGIPFPAERGPASLVQARAAGPAGAGRALAEAMASVLLTLRGELRPVGAGAFRDDAEALVTLRLVESEAPARWDVAVLGGADRVRLGYDALRGPAEAVRLETTTEAGGTMSAPCWESAARMSLRRAAEAVARGGALGDLALLAQSARLVDAWTA